jgi:hypothetical protein
MKNLLVAGIGIVSGIYLLNPGFGLFEFIPDAVPFIGNLDEATASFLVLSSLAYFGLDLRSVFGRWGTHKV